MESISPKDRDIVINPNEFVFVQDRTKGIISVAVGPAKQSLSDTEQLVRFDQKEKRFTADMGGGSAKQSFQTAPEGFYIILKNPASDGKQPIAAKLSNPGEGLLEVGKKVNLHGPIHIPLWPGQMAKVVRGHHLRSNQYLLLRVYDEVQARANWANAVLKPAEQQKQTGTEAGGTQTETGKQVELKTVVANQPPQQEETKPETKIDPENLVTGSLIILKGNEVSFYMPPTGIEVVSFKNANNVETFVRDAVTLERLEYCILLSESGEKRYLRGPDVVFPSPVETFMEKEKTNKFRAFELSLTSGIYIKVIAPYTDTLLKRDMKEGDEIFLTGKECQIYFPREEHAIIDYNDQKVHHAIALPAGQGRYVLDRNKGSVDIVKGEKMFLPDPRTQVVVKRILEDWECELFYPGNAEVVEFNRALRDKFTGEELDRLQSMVSNTMPKNLGRGISVSGYAASPGAYTEVYAAAAIPDVSIGDRIKRKSTYTPPRTITIDNKYEGPVIINIWTGYAVQVVSKSGARKVVEGPISYMLEFDETLEKLSFSSGIPKRSTQRINSVYLRTKNNHVADEIDVETRDLIPIKLKLSLHVNFDSANKDKWFEVENYVKLLVDRVRSLLRNQAKKSSVHEYMNNGIDMIRSEILDAKNSFFEENSMRISDVEVLKFQIDHPEIQKMMTNLQLTGVQKAIEVKTAQSLYDANRTLQEFRRKNLEEDQITSSKINEVEKHKLELAMGIDVIRAQNMLDLEMRRLQAQYAMETEQIEISQKILERLASENAQAIDIDKQRQMMQLELLQAQTKSEIDKLSAIQDGLIEALHASNQINLANGMFKEAIPLALVEGQSIYATVKKFLNDTGLGAALDRSIQPLQRKQTETQR